MLWVLRLDVDGCIADLIVGDSYWVLCVRSWRFGVDWVVTLKGAVLSIIVCM